MLTMGGRQAREPYATTAGRRPQGRGGHGPAAARGRAAAAMASVPSSRFGRGVNEAAAALLGISMDEYAVPHEVIEGAGGAGLGWTAAAVALRPLLWSQLSTLCRTR